MNAVSRAPLLPAATATQQLHEAELLVLWAVRVWTAHRRAGSALCGGFGRAFQRAGAPDAAALLHEIMEIALVGACGLDIRCVRCSRVGQEETRLLAALAAAQRHDFLACQDILTDFLAPAAARAAHARLATLGYHLSAAGLCLPQRSLGAALAQSRRAPIGCVDPGASLIH